MDSVFGAYLGTRERITELLIAVDEVDLARQVPACPEWSVEQLLAHVVSMPAAISRGRLPQGPIELWLQELIDERMDQSPRELIAEWQAMDTELQTLLTGGAELLFTDLAIHEHDIRGALDRPDHDALEVDEILPSALAAFDRPLREAGLGAIEVRDGDRVWRSHDAPVGWTLLVDPWTAVRAINSRRTAAELRALTSLGDANPYLAVLDAHLPLPTESLGER